MMISEAIQALQEIIDDVGDLELVSIVDVDGAFLIDHNRIFECVTPDGYDDMVVAFMDQIECPVHGGN
jgi:hypothetical protein